MAYEHIFTKGRLKVASEGINHHVEHCIFVPASRVLFSSRCPTFRVSLLSSDLTCSESGWRCAGGSCEKAFPLKFDDCARHPHPTCQFALSEMHHEPAELSAEPE